MLLKFDMTNVKFSRNFVCSERTIEWLDGLKESQTKDINSYKQLSLTSGLHVRRIEKTPPDKVVNITEIKHFIRLNTKPSISYG